MKIITKDLEVKNLTIWNFPNVKPPEMTSLQAELITTYKKLVSVFGKENAYNDGYKTQAEWHIITPDGFVTIYDYKQGKAYCGSEGIPKTKVTEWHIGGANSDVVGWIIKVMNNN